MSTLRRNLEIVERVKAGEPVASIAESYGITRQRVDQVFRLMCPGESIAQYKPARRQRSDTARRTAIREAILNGATTGRAIAAKLRCSTSDTARIVSQLRAEDPAIAALLVRQEVKP
jgi:hypothetical protein